MGGARVPSIKPTPPTEAFVADVVVSKHADHIPLYRQSQILARSRVIIERSTLAQWVGASAAELQPLHDYLVRSLKASPRGAVRDPLSRARSRAQQDQDRLHVGLGPR